MMTNGEVMNHTNELLQNYFQAFSAGHERLRQQLLESLPAVQSKITWRNRVAALRTPLWLKPSLAAAAVLVVLLSVMMFSSTMTDTQTAFATSINNLSHAQSIHLKVQTGASTMEVWWRRPNEYRMAFSNGMIIVSNAQQRFVLNSHDKTFKVSSAEKGDMDMMVLGPFGMLFTSEEAMKTGWLDNQKLIHREEIVYKDQKCLKLTYEDGVRRGVYIVEPELHLICQATLSPKERPESISYHMEVYEINDAIPSDLFQLEKPEGYRLIEPAKTKTMPLSVLPSLPATKK